MEHAGSVPGRRRSPFGQSGADFFIGELDVEPPIFNVDDDDVPFAQRGDGAARGGLGRDVAYHQSARGAAESPVGHQRNALAQAFADDGRRHAQHLAHSGAAFRAFVAYHYDVAVFNLFASDGCHRVFFTFEDSRGSAVVKALVPRDLDDRAFGREIPFQDHEPTTLFDRIVGGVYHVLPRSLAGQFRLLPDGQTADGHLATVNIALFDKPARDQADSARAPQIDRRVFPARLQVGDQWSAFADLIEIFDLQIDAGLAQ